MKHLLTNALFGLVICTALAAGVGSLMQAKMLLSANVDPTPGGTVSGDPLKCILSISACPLENPACGKEPVKMTVNCTDPACLQGTCTLASSPSVDPNPTPNPNPNQGSGGGGTTNDSCVIRRFACSDNGSSSCYKRWHSSAISCTASSCTADVCMKSDTFFSKYSMQPWDLGPLAGPFPRTETLCAVAKSSCPQEDPFCLNPANQEQVSCDDTRCTQGLCTRMAVFVDQHDTILNTNGTTGSTGGSGNAGGTDNSGSGNQETSDSHQQTGNTDGGSNGNSGSTDKSNGGVVTAPVVQVLGCFDDAGNWTTDRSKCAAPPKPTSGQSSEPTQQTSTVEQKVVERAIETKFIPDTRKNALVQKLLSSTIDASGRLGSLLENPSLPDDLRQQAQTALDAMKTVQNNATEPDVSVTDLQALADTVTSTLVSVQQGTVQWKQGGSSDVPVTVTGKLDSLFQTIPSIFALLQQEGISTTSQMIDQYTSASQIYTSVHDACIADANTCGNLSKAIDALDPLFASIKQAVQASGKTDLEMKIDTLMQ